MEKEENKFISSDILEGMTSISALIHGMEAGVNNRRIIRILFDHTKNQSKRAELGFLRAKATQMSFTIDMVDPDIIDRISIGNTHGGIIAECTSRILPKLSSEYIKENGFYFILDGVEDPYNFGYAIRSLYAAGVDGLILGERNWMGAAGVVARSSAGASERMPLYVCSPINAVSLMKNRGYTVICAEIRKSESLFETDLSKPLLVILGGEKRGISRNVLDLADKFVRIDYGSDFKGSLSTSASAAVFAFEVLRQNNLKK